MLSLFPMYNNKSNDDNLLREVIGDYKNDQKLYVAHPEDFNLDSEGEDTIIFISDSFGEGEKCGNYKRRMEKFVCSY